MLKSNQEIEHLNASRRLGIIFGLGGALVGIIFVAFGFYTQYKKAKKANVALEIAYKQLEETQQQLVESEKKAAFGEVATRVAHEILNPLNFVNNFSKLSNGLVEDLLEESDAGEREEIAKQLHDNLHKIAHHGKRADTIVKELLEHTRAGTAHQFFEEEGETG